MGVDNVVQLYVEFQEVLVVDQIMEEQRVQEILHL
jgi:hypothetical protein